MPFADNEGLKIYYEVEGSGPDLILAHGLSSTGEDWRELGYVAQLRRHYRLILVDARGHGQSDKPHDPHDYSPESRVRDYLAVLDDLGVSKAHYWGFSSGGVVGFCSAKYAPERFISVTIGGLDPYPDTRDIGDRNPLSRKPLQGLPEGDDPVKIALEQGGDTWLHFWQSNMSVPDGMRTRLPDNDFSALIALWEQPYQWRDEVEPLLAKFPYPCLLYVGDAENNYVGMKACAKEMPLAEFITLPGFHHFDIWANSDSIVPHVKRFLERVERV